MILPFILHYIVAPADAKGLPGDPCTVFESTKRSTAAPEITARGSIRSTWTSLSIVSGG